MKTKGRKANMKIDIDKRTITIPLDKITISKLKKYPVGKLDVDIDFHWKERRKLNQ